MMILSCVFIFIGLFALSLSMKRHFKQCYPQRKMPSLKRLFVFRISGYVGLSISMYLCIIAQGLGLGLVVWFGVATIVALLQVLLLSYIQAT
jgi:hypothetical protein